MSNENQIQLASEEVTRRNVKAAVDYSNETRKMLRETEEVVKQLKNMVVQQNSEISQLRAQMTTLLIEKYNGKATE